MNFKLTISQKKDYSENLYKIPLYKMTLPLVNDILALKYSFSKPPKSKKSPKRKSSKSKKSPKRKSPKSRKSPKRKNSK